MAKRKKRKSPAQKKRKAARGRTQKHPQQSFGRFVFKWLFVLGLWGGIGLAGLIAWYAGELPDITRQASFERKTSITIKAHDGTVITRYGEMRGNSVAVEDLPPHLIYAVLAIEDRRFYQHFGIDLIGLGRAMATNLTQGRLAQGGSTITQQLAKNLFLSRERTLKRKIQEALLALWLERELTKDEILSAYLNRVYLGSGTYGVEAAARRYFDKPVTEINIREAALLAGLLKAPSRYSPLHNPDLSKQRTAIVLQAMVDTGYITEAAAGNGGGLPPVPAQPASANAMRYYTDWVVDGIDELIGTPSEDIIIETTLNPGLQQAAEQALARIIRDYGGEAAVSQGAVIVLRPDGAVVAMVGGTDYALSQFNRATQAKRQPGSAFKPVLYLTALEQGWEPDDTLIDEPITEGKYRPQNFGGEYFGEVTLEEAFAASLNTPAVRLMQHVGRRPVIDTARKLGIYSPMPENLSLALGSASLSPLELATAYAVIANGGMAVYPYAITKITDQDGQLYYKRPARPTTRRVVDKHHARDLTAMMNTVIQEGTGRRANLGFKAAGKTGTSQDSRDAWFSGFTDELVTTVWLGNDDNSPMKSVTGAGYPLTIWQDVMKAGHNQYNPISSRDFRNSSFNDLLSKILPGSEPSAQKPYNE